jgi:hypothetical protein
MTPVVIRRTGGPPNRRGLQPRTNTPVLLYGAELKATFFDAQLHDASNVAFFSGRDRVSPIIVAVLA